MSDEQLSDLARRVIDSNSYMALGTADEAGHRVQPPSSAAETPNAGRASTGASE
jgi:hypothetical protein